jgi:hypothetical protein
MYYTKKKRCTRYCGTSLNDSIKFNVLSLLVLHLYVGRIVQRVAGIFTCGNQCLEV